MPKLQSNQCDISSVPFVTLRLGLEARCAVAEALEDFFDQSVTLSLPDHFFCCEWSQFFFSSPHLIHTYPPTFFAR